MDVLEAYVAFLQQRWCMPKKDGIQIPREIFSKLTIDFKKGWDSITGEQQQQIAKEEFPRNDTSKAHCDNNSQVQVYQA